MVINLSLDLVKEFMIRKPTSCVKTGGQGLSQGASLASTPEQIDELIFEFQVFERGFNGILVCKGLEAGTRRFLRL
jgi:hypothetical protein